ncbi:protease subunit of ATP-dependent protease [Candidatus Methanoperedens nitroreducens]|uniref:endopeptidase Clp n=1 Tax=Candidatus Methanoperedens nitratireducens TaxID=1392998 RepID=A0A062V8H9_9EURY|nr:ATP-dependent Clp protease proteolytic subunit [Candidatus Methanoperedens nitroreducens]KCZ72858.1 protease subunit of ATP-dependent protease [Candidatus Methanoperedens nitroreducens]MDJ1423216.1 ATP-dependent Clp protease proteolytic subunit [Candidatus Methanoperedens sp.]
MAAPKTLYVAHGTQSVDIYSRLLDDQIIFLTGEINDDTAESIIAQLLYLESKDFEGDIQIYINSPGGLITSGLAIYDAMQCISCSVATICVGQASSMAAVLLAAGTKEKRMAFPDARMMIHQPLGGAQGQASDIEIQAKEMSRVKKRMNEILVYHTGQPMEVIERDTDRDFFLTAEEATKYGLIDRIVRAGEGIVKRIKRS